MNNRVLIKAFAAVALSFALGVMIGYLCAVGMTEGHILELSEERSFASRLYTVAFFPALVVLAGSSLLGVIALPLITGVKGFSLAFTMAVIVSTIGADGRPAYLLHQAVPVIISVTLLLFLAAHSMVVSAKLLRLTARNYIPSGQSGSRYWFRVVLCAVVLTAVAALTS